MGGRRLTDTLRVRPARAADAQLVTDLLSAVDLHDFGEADIDVATLRDEWRLWDLEHDSWLAFDGERLVGSAALDRRRPPQPELWLTVHPDHRRKGIGARLLELAESRALQAMAEVPEGERVELRSFVNAADPASAAWAQRRGFAPVRRYWRMRIDQTDPPPAPELPEPIRIRTFVRGQDERATWAAVEESFRDHWGSTPMAFERWVQRLEGEQFDPSLWFLAVEGEEIAGFSLCTTFLKLGWVGSLGVRSPWRGGGIGMGLLLRSFGEFWRRGHRSVALGVDSENVTGATRLYERAGMRVDRAHDLYVKVLRDGA